MLEELNIWNPTLQERIDKSTVQNIIKAKMKSGMGVITKLDSSGF
jgi:hypothetical protein